MNHRINHANIKEWAKNYDGPQFDGILCDPPYELGFMGKSWDSSGIAFDQDMWADLFRHIKPGGHLLAFSGSRTYHRMAVAIEDAGFEIRDMIEWVYGSGFPKSLNIGKAVDKINGRFYDKGFQDYCNERRINKGYSHNDVNKLMDTATTGGGFSSSIMGNKIQNELPTLEMYTKLKPILGLDDRYDELIATTEAKRDVIGTKTAGIGSGKTYAFTDENDKSSKTIDITAPATEEAKQYEGYGTALKPAHEPCVLARKPLEKGMTVAGNALKHGVGGIAIDNTRIKPEYHLQRSVLLDIIRVCQLDHLLLPANSVGLKRFQDDTTNVIKRLCSVLETADTPTSEKTPGTQQENIIKKVTSCLEETLTENTKLSLNTSTSGKKPTDEISQQDMKSTILTVSKMITDWKISSSSVSQLIEVLLTQAKTLKTTNDVQGRFPSNFIHDGSDEVEAVFPQTGKSSGGRIGNKGSMINTMGNAYEKGDPGFGDSGSASRYFKVCKDLVSDTPASCSEKTYDVVGLNGTKAQPGLYYTAKSSKSERNAGLEGFEDVLGGSLEGGNDKRKGDRPQLQPTKNHHPTVKPLSLTKYLATLIKPPTGGRLLVPFSGSGSEMIGALQAGWDYVEGVELTEEYIPIAEARIKYWLELKAKEKPQLELI